jgi:hypothetical protein
MKNKILVLFLITGLFTACSDHFLELDPLDEITEAAYFTEASHFKTATNDFYDEMMGWRHFDVDHLDSGSDLTGITQDYGSGNVVAPNTDDWWNDEYENIRNVNILLKKAEEFEGDATEIAEYVAVAKFFRAYHHFFLLQRFGGVPVITEVLDLDSEMLTAPRNSRYEVFAQIYADLQAAIPDLLTEQEIASTDKGKISKWAAEAFLAKALLWEATWEMNVGTTTDGDGTTSGAGSTKPSGYLSTSTMISEANTLAKDIMDNGGYELWNKNDDALMENWSNCYLFDLEDSGSNPGGYDKSTNNEFILYTSFDYSLYKGNTNISHIVPGRLGGSRKLMDMFLCADGLPIAKSDLFQGYKGASDEYKNRDLRMTSYFADYTTWDTPEDGSINLISSTVEGYGYKCRKFRSYNYGSYRALQTESYNFPQIRLAEVYLIYAETLYHLNGSITDAQLNESINLVKARAGLPALTNAFAEANGMDIWDELMRERTLELYAENSRFNDLKRFAIAEETLNDYVLGPVIEGTDYDGNADLYTPENWPYGEIEAETGSGMLNVTVINIPANNNFQRMHYLWPLPLEEINLNENLLQNPGY